VVPPEAQDGAAGEGPAEGEPGRSVVFVGGTGAAAGIAIGAAGTDRYALVLDEPVEEWARMLVESEPETPAEPAALALIERVRDADVSVAWSDAEGVAALLSAITGGLGPVPPPAEIRGIVAGLWLGDRPRAQAFVEARGPDAAAAVADAFRIALTVMQLSASVLAAQLGHDYGADVQARTERVSEISRRVEVGNSGAFAFARVDLSQEELDLVQGLLLALASRRLEAP